MINLPYIILGLLIVLDDQYRQYILTHVHLDFFVDECLQEIFVAIQAMIEEERTIDIIAVRERIMTDADSKLLERRLKIIRKYLAEQGMISTNCSSEELAKKVGVLLVDITRSVDYSIPVETLVRAFTLDYVSNKKQQIISQYQLLVQENPGKDYSEELSAQLKSLDSLLSKDSWKQFTLDLERIEAMPNLEPIIYRKEQGFFWRGNLYLISGFAGSMKSYFCLAIVAATQNRGSGADRTLSFYTAKNNIKVLWVDTELAINTVKKRILALKKMTGGKLDLDYLVYMSLTKVADAGSKIKALDDACRSYKPDIIIVDSGRDLCLDYNDNRECDTLISHLKQMAASYDAVIISTCHKSLNNGNPKGHYGMKFNEACGLEMSLTKASDGNDIYIKVEFPKQREDTYAPFSFMFNADTLLLNEYNPNVDRQEENRQFQKAESALRKSLRPGEKVHYNILKSRLMAEPISVCDGTAKSYIRLLLGTVLIKDVDGTYQLADNNLEIDFDDIPA